MAQKKSFLLSSICIENYAVVCKLAAPSKPSEKTLQEIIDLLKNHFITQALSDFLTRKKATNEKVKNFYAELKKLA